MKVDLDGLAANIKSCIDPKKDVGGWAYMVDEMVRHIRQLEANVGGGDTAMRAMGYEIEHLHGEVERLKAFAKSFLNPEENGRAVSAYIRDEARAALGMERVERVQP